MEAPRVTPARGDVDPRDYVQSLERGLSVLLAFAGGARRLSLSEISEATGLSRPTVRRLLLTLEVLGYVAMEGRHFVLTPRVLAIGNAYLESLDVAGIARPVMERIAATVRETCTLATLDGAEIVYVSRVPGRRASGAALTVGARLPAHATAMGQVLLAGLPAPQLEAYLETTTLHAYTSRTVTDGTALRGRLEEIRGAGYGLVADEFEEGLRSVAVAVRGWDGRSIAALGVSTTVPGATLVTDVLPVLRQAATEVSARLGGDGAAGSA